MTRSIIAYPDKRLKTVSKAVEQFDELLHALLDDMYDTMIASNGIGLAAIQVGVPLRALIINMPDEEGEQYKANLLEMINPTLSQCKGNILYQEGCLSVPGFYEDIDRFEKVNVTYYDRHGAQKSITTEELFSVAIQHEIDHLDGKLFIEKLSYTRRKKFEKEYKKQLKAKK